MDMKQQITFNAYTSPLTEQLGTLCTVHFLYTTLSFYSFVLNLKHKKEYKCIRENHFWNYLFTLLH